MYLLDTDILSNLMKRNPSVRLRARVASVPAEAQFSSSITLGELMFGAKKKGSSRLVREVEDRVASYLPMLPFDADAARRYGDVRAELERRGTPIGDADLRIASIALARGLIVVTGNTKHFARVPDLILENWLS
jgi:tRNA(fMet)-specific endonuclease VapC